MRIVSGCAADGPSGFLPPPGARFRATVHRTLFRMTQRMLDVLPRNVNGLYLAVYSFIPLRDAEMNDEAPLTITVPEAGKRYFNLSRDASYAAAQRGDIPTIRVGRLLRVPVRAMERLLDTAGERERRGTT